MKTEEAREAVLKKVLLLKGKNCLLELATGTGKSKLALDRIKYLHEVLGDKEYGCSLLIVVHRNFHKQNWEEEIKKWYPNNNLTIRFTTYVSLPKYKGTWTYAIFDECHHLSERCREALCDFDIGYSVLLSATVNRNLKDSLIEIFDNLECISVDIREAIDSGILPDPKVYLIPLQLSQGFPTEMIIKNPKAKGRIIESSFIERWKYYRQKSNPVRVYCTEKQYLQELNGQIEWWKQRYMQTRNEGVRAKWLRLCNDRLEFLSRKKNNFLCTLLQYLDKYRTLTFCSSIEQTEILGEHCINSKSTTESSVNYLRFNRGEINHITACNMLNEGMNLVDCQIGIYANLNSSETIIKQRAGRLLRHKNPIIIVPYYKGTREEELVEKMLENYNPELVSTVLDISDIRI